MRAARKSRNFLGFGARTYSAALGRHVSSDVERKRLLAEKKSEDREKRAESADQKREEKDKTRRLLEELKDDAFEAGQSDKRAGRKGHPYRLSLIVSPRYEEAFGKRRARELVEAAYKQGQRQNPNPCARTLKSTVSDRAHRYRANQKNCRPSGLKKCKLCRSRSGVMIDHVDGNESNGKKSNLRWLCRSCNNTLGAEMARTGQGRRTVQYNPAHKGALTLGEYMQAVLQHTRGAHDAAGKIIHETPKSKRREFASEIWARRESHGTSRPGSSRTGTDEPDWVTNPPQKSKGHLFFQDGFEWYKAGDEIYRAPLDAVMDVRSGYRIGRWEFPVWQLEQRKKAGVYPFEKANPAASAAQYRLAQAVLSGTARETGMSKEAAREIVDRTPAHLRSEYSRSNPSADSTSTEYRLGYNLGQMDRQTAALRKTARELLATFESNFGVETSASSDAFESGYSAGYGLGSVVANPLSHGPRPGGMNATENRHDAEVRKLIAKRFAEGEDAEKVAKRVWRSYGYLTDVKGGVLIVQLNAGRETFTPAGRSNPETDDSEYEQARKIAELFHGRPVKEEITVTESIREHDWLWRIGPLILLKIRTLTKRSASLPFAREGEAIVHLFCSPDGRQLYLRGGDQELDLKPLGMEPGTDWYRDQMLLGEAKEITYADKKRLHRFKPVEYFHKLGEVSKKKPMLAYDALAKRLSIVGGQYRVETEDLVDGMSPGIVN